MSTDEAIARIEKFCAANKCVWSLHRVPNMDYRADIRGVDTRDSDGSGPTPAAAINAALDGRARRYPGREGEDT